MKVETELEGLLEALGHKIEEATAASKVTNALLLANKMGLDATKPTDAQRILRHLKSVESYVQSDSDD